MNLVVSDLASTRFQTALELLDEGGSFTYNRVTFRLLPEGTIECSVASSWDLPGITERTATDDFEHADGVIAELLSQPAFAMRVAKRETQLVLLFDYGNGAVELCRRAACGLVWTSAATGRSP